MRAADVIAVVIAYAVMLVAAGLALGALGTGHPWAAVVAVIAGVVSFYLACKGEAALDAQVLDEFEGEFMD